MGWNIAVSQQVDVSFRCSLTLTIHGVHDSDYSWNSGACTTV